jgi:hypothetical protein
MKARTVLELIVADYRAGGGRGHPPRRFIDCWRKDHADTYGKWPLSTLFISGSRVAIRGRSRLDRASAAWLAAGNGAPFGEAWEKFYADYRDEFDEQP